MCLRIHEITFGVSLFVSMNYFKDKGSECYWRSVECCGFGKTAAIFLILKIIVGFSFFFSMNYYIDKWWRVLFGESRGTGG